MFVEFVASGQLWYLDNPLNLVSVYYIIIDESIRYFLETSNTEFTALWQTLELLIYDVTRTFDILSLLAPVSFQFTYLNSVKSLRTPQPDYY